MGITGGDTRCSSGRRSYTVASEWTRFLYECHRSIRRTGRGLAAMQVLLSLQLLLAVTKAPAMVKAITDAGDIAALVQVRVFGSFSVAMIPICHLVLSIEQIFWVTVLQKALSLGSCSIEPCCK